MMHDRTGQPFTFDALQDALRSFFQRQLNKSLELSHDLPDDQELDLGAEIEGLHELVQSLRHKLARQSFSGLRSPMKPASVPI